jgi:acylphosphatase
MAGPVVARLVVRGRVQGVWYRGSMQREARRLGLVGWVRNCDDGSVEAEVAGEQEAVDAMIAWARRGPTGARVTGVDVSWRGTGAAGWSDFVVRG